MQRKILISFLLLLASSTLIGQESSYKELNSISQPPQEQTTKQEDDDSRKIQKVVFEAVSQRHQIAVQALSKLLEIIHDSRRKRNEAESNIEVYTHVFNDAL